MTRPRVLLADDHRMVLDGLRGLLAPHFELVGEVGDGQRLVELACEVQPDVIVLDISMPVLNGIEALTKLRGLGCGARAIFLTMHSDAVYVHRAFSAGADGYILKNEAFEELVGAIRGVLEGRRVRSARLPEGEGAPAGTTSGEVLTVRQREVLQLLAEGRSARESGQVLGISARTVEAHKYKMMEQLGLKTSAELIQFAMRNGLTSK